MTQPPNGDNGPDTSQSDGPSRSPATPAPSRPSPATASGSLPRDVVFISYARTDSEFVDRLEADLQARNIRTWVDRRKLQGGQDWHDQIQGALDYCRALLVVLSPDTVASRNARSEYRYALNLGKPVIPLLFKPTPKVPMDLNDIQWVVFQEDYDKGFNDLLIALETLPTSATPLPYAGSLPTRAPDGGQDADTSDLVAAHPAHRARAADLNSLYRAGVKARTEGEPERAVVLWQQVLNQDPEFGAGSLAGQLRELNQQVRPLRIQRLQQRIGDATRAGEWGQVAGSYKALLGLEPENMQAQQGLRAALRSQAEKAHREGAWRDEIIAWETLLQLEPGDRRAQDLINIATRNRQSAWHYENAQEFVKDGDLGAARAELEMLWHDAPFYGDPAGLASAVGVQVPQGYDAAQVTQAKARARAQAQTKRQQASVIGAISAVVLLALLGSGAILGAGGQGPMAGALFHPTPTTIPTPPTPTATPLPTLPPAGPGTAAWGKSGDPFGLNYPTSWFGTYFPPQPGFFETTRFRPTSTAQVWESGSELAVVPEDYSYVTNDAAVTEMERLETFSGRSGFTSVGDPSKVTIHSITWTQATFTFMEQNATQYKVIGLLTSMYNQSYFVLYYAPAANFDQVKQADFSGMVDTFRFLK